MSNYTLNQNVTRDSGRNNPGVSWLVYMAPRRDFDTIQVPAGSPADASAEFTISTAHTFTTGNGFYKFEFVPSTTSFSLETLGEGMSKTVKTTLPGTIKGTDTGNMAVVTAALYDDWIVIVKEVATGNMRQIGTEVVPAVLETIEGGSGTTGADGGNQMALTFAAEIWPYTYTGTITDKP